VNNGNGTATLSCGDGTSVTIPLGPNEFACETRPDLWQEVDSTTSNWVWTSSRIFSNVGDADFNRTLYVGDQHRNSVPNTASLDGTGYVSTAVFTMNGCDTDWYHLGGWFSGNCYGHDGDQVRRLVMDTEACYDYSNFDNNGGPGAPEEEF